MPPVICDALLKSFIDASNQRFFAHTRRFGGASWLNRMKFSGAAALMKIANQKVRSPQEAARPVECCRLTWTLRSAVL